MSDIRMCFHPVSGGGGATAESGNTASADMSPARYAANPVRNTPSVRWLA